jgi:hypothetical protein
LIEVGDKVLKKIDAWSRVHDTGHSVAVRENLIICRMFVSLVYCAESTVRWFVVREKHYWMTADSADKSKLTGPCLVSLNSPPNFTIQKEDSLSHQNIGKCMEY